MTRYDKNETMKLIGEQSIGTYIDNERVQKAIHDIVSAYELEELFKENVFHLWDVIMDVFLYGTIEGKREERQKKKAIAEPTK